MDKQVENCEIRMKPDATVVIFQIKFTNAPIKKYSLPIIESEKLEVSIIKLLFAYMSYPTQNVNPRCIHAKNRI